MRKRERESLQKKKNVKDIQNVLKKEKAKRDENISVVGRLRGVLEGRVERVSRRTE